MPSATRVFSLTVVMSKAWCLARAGARCFGGRPRAYLAAAFRQAWSQAKALAATIAAQCAWVLAEVERVRFEFSPLGVARRRREETALEAELAAHRLEMRARAIAYNARWGAAATPAARAA